MKLYVWRYVHGENYLTEQPYYTADKLIDDAVSIVWCERYQKPGEFVLLLRATPELFAYFCENHLLITREESDTVMIPELITLTTSAEDGNYLRITGYSAENILNQRAVWQTETRSGKADELIYYFIRENIGSFWYFHTDADHIPNYRFRYINLLEPGDHAPMNGETEVQLYGKRLGDFVFSTCEAFRFGFRIIFENGKLKYSCYQGNDRTIRQDRFPAVIFAEEFENLGDTVYTLDRSTYFNRFIIGGEGDGKTRKEAVYTRSIQKNAGILMREKFIDAKNVSSNSDGIQSEADYLGLLQAIASDAANAAEQTESFGGDVLPGGQFVYRKDYFMGDTVTVRNAYGITGTAVVSEIVETEDESGYRLIPVFMNAIPVESTELVNSVVYQTSNGLVYKCSNHRIYALKEE